MLHYLLFNLGQSLCFFLLYNRNLKSVRWYICGWYLSWNKELHINKLLNVSILLLNVCICIYLKCIVRFVWVKYTIHIVFKLNLETFQYQSSFRTNKLLVCDLCHAVQISIIPIHWEEELRNGYNYRF